MSPTLRNNIINWVSVQLAWLACVVGGNLWAVLALVLCLAWHSRVAFKGEWKLIVGVALYGTLQDTVLHQLGGLSFPRGDAYYGVIAPWLILLWVVFATQFKHCMLSLMKRPWLAFVFGVIAPMSYFGGTRLGAIELTSWAYVYLCVCWAFFLSVLSWCFFYRQSPSPVTA